MKSRIAVLCVVLVAGCDAPADPAATRIGFEQAGASYEWALAHGARGSLSLLRMTGAGQGYPMIVMTCQDRKYGGLQIRDASSAEGPMSVTAGDRVFEVDARTREGFSAPTFGGDAAFPSGWFQALGRAERVQFHFGRETLDVPGPGVSSVANYKDYCTQLARRSRS